MNYHLRHALGMFVVSSTSFVSPLENAQSIMNELKSKQYEGKVLFDLLCVNGNEYNRFMTISFVDDKFDFSSLCVLTDLNDYLIDSQDDFYRMNNLFLTNSVLTETSKQPYFSAFS